MIVIENALQDYIDNPIPVSKLGVKIPKYFYHGTSYDFLDQIDEKGLGISGEGSLDYQGVHKEIGFFVDTDPREAYEYATKGDVVDSEDVVVLEIPSKYLNKDNLFLDYNNEEAVDFIEGFSADPGPAFFYKGVLTNVRRKVSILDI